MLLKKLHVQLQPQQAKENIQIGSENKLNDSSDSEFEKLLDSDKSFSEGEEERDMPH